MKTYTEEEVRLVIAGMQAEIDALKLVQQEQAGWQLVPVEPTEAMCIAAVKFANGPAVYKNVAAEALKIEESIYSETYQAMLAAAPKGEKP